MYKFVFIKTKWIDQKLNKLRALPWDFHKMIVTVTKLPSL